MIFIIDNALSPRVAKGLKEAGYNAMHVRDIGMAAASDIGIINYAQKNDGIIVSADTDFGFLLALRKETRPSFILFKTSDKRPDYLLRKLLAILDKVLKDLEHGAVIVIENERIRIRKLPIINPSE